MGQILNGDHMTHIIDEIYQDDRSKRHYHRCKEKLYTDDMSGSASIYVMHSLELVKPLRCPSCSKKWKTGILKFLKLKDSIGA